MSITYDRTRSSGAKGGKYPKGRKASVAEDNAELTAPGEAAVLKVPGIKPFNSLSAGDRLRLAYARLESLRRVNGGYVTRAARPGSESQTSSVPDFLNIIDNIFVSYANECVGAPDKAAETARLVSSVFKRSGASVRAAACRIHPPGAPAPAPVPRSVHPTTFEPVAGETPGLDLPTIGLFLLRTADLLKRGGSFTDIFGGAPRAEVSVMLRDLLLFLDSAHWFEDPDTGFWADGAMLRSSSVGVVVAGLGAWQDAGEAAAEFLPIPPSQVERGSAALERLLPREGTGRMVDMAQLGLIYPCGVLDTARAVEVIRGVEAGLVRSRGLIRYVGDRFMNSGPGPGAAPEGGEAQYPAGLAWLSAGCSHTALGMIKKADPLAPPDELISRAERYLEKLESLMAPDGRVPGCYLGGAEADDIVRPLPQSLYVVARTALDLAHEAMGWR